MLREFALVYLRDGQREFETRESSSLTFCARQACMLFPGVWHRYRPNPKTGWE
jgi:hypothetical protein